MFNNSCINPHMFIYKVQQREVCSFKSVDSRYFHYRARANADSPALPQLSLDSF